MKPPVKIDVAPGGEWLLPAAKRWLEQAKRVMGRVGSKVVDMGDLGRVTLSWGPALDYIRIAVTAGFSIVGYSMLTGDTQAKKLQLYDRSGNIKETISLPDGYVQFRTDGLRISSDGKTVSVSCSTSGTSGHYVFRWTKENGLVRAYDGFGGFGNLSFGVSKDGETIVGYGRPSSGAPLLAFKLRGSVYTPLDMLPGHTFFSLAYGVDDSGDIVVGQSVRSSSTLINPAVVEAVVWNNSTTPMSLGYAVAGHNNSIANGISRSGEVIVGVSYELLPGGAEGPTARTAFKWSAGAGITPLYAPAGYTFPGALDTVDDASVVVGFVNSPTLRAVVWRDTVPHVLPMLSSSLTSDVAEAYAVSANGKVIVGICTVSGLSKPVMWVDIGEAQYDAVELPSVEGFPKSGARDVA